MILYNKKGMKFNIKTSRILTILVLICLLILLIYLIRGNINSVINEGLNDEPSTFIVTMTNKGGNDVSASDIFDNAKKNNTDRSIITETNNSIPSHLEYNISSIKSDSNITKPTTDIIIDNTPSNVQLDSLKLPSSKKRTTESVNTFIMVSPKTKDTFPLYFQFKLENNTQSTNMSIDLWGDHYTNASKSRPPGNPNSVIGPGNLSLYVPDMDASNIPGFTYSKDVFSKECFVKSNTLTCTVGDFELGTRIINIIQTGDIFDIDGTKIGYALKTNTSKTSTSEEIIVTIESGRNITGLLLYMGSLVKL